MLLGRPPNGNGNQKSLSLRVESPILSHSKMTDSSGKQNGARGQRAPTESGGLWTRMPTGIRVLEGFTAAIILFQIIFAPWAFGTTDDWSERILAASGYLLGAALLTQRILCRRNRYAPPRWSDRAPSSQKRLTKALAISTVAILGYILVSAVNERARFSSADQTFNLNDNYLAWLPHSFAAGQTWDFLLKHAALALSFWAIRDWILGKSARERFLEREFASRTDSGRQATLLALNSQIPDRLRTLLWILCVNGGVLALVAILQRLHGTDKLLWMVQPYWRKTGDLHFGPYAYRTNAAQYLNLLWPISLGFWLSLRKRSLTKGQRQVRVGTQPYLALVPCAAIMLSGPFISTSRGGAIIAFVLLIPIVAVFWTSIDRSGIYVKLGLLVFLASSIALASHLGGDALSRRIALIPTKGLQSRSVIHETAREMAKDHPWFGVGGGAFEKVYLLYKPSQRQWDAFAHDDWLETRVTLGRLGFLLCAVGLTLVALKGISPPEIGQPWELWLANALALCGLFIHSFQDFPLQVHSILHLALICLVLCSLGFKRPFSRMA